MPSLNSQFSQSVILFCTCACQSARPHVGRYGSSRASSLKSRLFGSAVDGRTDVFALGTLTYELLTGRNPFADVTASDTIVNIIKGAVTPPSEANPAVPPDLDAVVTKALSPDIEKRQQSAAAFAAELRSVAAVLDVRSGDTVEPSALLHLDESPDRKASGMLWAALLVAAAAAAGVWYLLSRN